MEGTTVVTVRFGRGRTVVYRNATVLEVLRELLSMDLDQHPPLLIEVGTFVKLYWSRSALHGFAHGDTSFGELVDKLWCDGLARNSRPVISREGVEVDPGSLWAVRARDCVLVNDDEWASMPADHPAFERID